MSPVVRVFPDRESLTQAAVDETIEILGAAVARRGHASLVLAGGSTPRALYEGIVRDAADRLDWSRVWFYFGDERFVDASSSDRNERLARTSLLDPLGIPAERIVAMPAPPPNDVARAAELYEARLTEAGPPSPEAPESRVVFDLVWLGLGEDGHTASLFPSDPVLDETERWVRAVDRSPTPPHVPRITLTLAALAAARTVRFLATGGSKRPALTRVLDADATSPGALPAARVAPRTGDLAWFIDRDAAPR